MNNRASSLVFGMTDGVVLVLGLFLGEIVARQTGAAIWHAALGGGLAELGGMSLGQYWANPAAGKMSAALNGLGCAAATIAAGAPFAFAWPRAAATLGSSMIIVTIAVIICVLREETGWSAIAHTFGLLLIAGALSGASGLI